MKIMTKQRVQMLLEPRQRQKLAKLAQTQGKSIAEITRQAIDAGLELMSQNDAQIQLQAALDAAQRLRERMRQRTGNALEIDIVGDIRQMREERDEEITCCSGL
jgi:hypothetical protein